MSAPYPWTDIERRRFDLVLKQHSTGLDELEAAELAALNEYEMETIQ